MSDQDLDLALEEIKHCMQGVRWSLHGVYAFGFGIGVQVKEQSRKVGPIIFPREDQTLADVFTMLGQMAERDAKPEDDS